MTPEETAWTPCEFVGGATCLDLVNTVGGRTKERRDERLPSYAALVIWARAAGVLDAAEANTLSAVAAIRPDEAERSLREIRGFREALYRLLSAVAARDEPEPRDIAPVNDAIAKACAAARITWRAGRLVRSVDADNAGLDTILCRTALSALRLIESDEVNRLRECGRCSWLFLDRSKSGRRRWCRMDACGNRAKAERHYRKRRR